MPDLLFCPGGNSPRDIEFAEKYTRSVYKKTSDKNILDYVNQLKEEYPFEDDKYCHIMRDPITAKDYQLTRQETIAFINCISCDKIRMNNSFRYCSKTECPYYFSFETIIATHEPIEV